jgi:anti-anti-sigma factor
MDGESAGAAVIVTLPDEIDVTNCDSVGASLAVYLYKSSLVIADMTGTTFCDSSGLQMLMVAHQRAAVTGSALRVAVTPGDGVARVLAIVGLDRMLDVYASVEDAVAAKHAAID